MNTKAKNKALFLDRDGTINLEKNYVYKISDFEFLPGIFDLIHYFQNKGYLIFIITNQSGIARGYYTEQDFHTLNNWMLAEFEKENIKITKVYFCPHHPDFSNSCKCRKPKPGMILQATREYHIDLKNTVLIGDKKRDILAGKNAGIGKNVYIQDLIEKGRFKTTDL
jgi:D-glycero-D-manno-heptose 1,7-bisphosphate phosphatase